MAWVRLDDGFTQHPKVVAAGPLAIAMQVAALCYCNKNLTDGFVPRSVARTLLDWQVVRADGRVYDVGVACGMSGDNVSCGWVIDVLVEAGMWDEAPGGYRIHDYHDYQPTRDEVLELSAKRAEAGRLGGLRRAANQANQANDQASAQAKSKQNSSPYPVPVSGASNEAPGPPLVPPDGVIGADAPPKPKRAKAIDDEWQPTTELYVWAANELSILAPEVNRETVKFKDHYKASGKSMKNWDAAWRNWMRRSREFGPARAGPNGTSPKRATPEGFARIAGLDTEGFARIAGLDTENAR